jgi:hypothetical protein
MTHIFRTWFNRQKKRLLKRRPTLQIMNFLVKQFSLMSLLPCKDLQQSFFTHIDYILLLFLLWRCDPTQVLASSCLRFLDHTQRRTRVGRTPLDEWSARRRDLYLTTYNNHNKQISMPPVGCEPTISAGERPQTYALDRAATGNGTFYF